MDALEHIRLRPGMYIGDSETPTKLLIECLDNAIDEVQNGHADKLFVSINTINKEFIVADSGRGLPFNHKLPLLEDPPILICNSIFTSGKYKKSEEQSAYKVAAGLHGVGMTACNALSEYMFIDIYKNKKHAQYEFNYKKTPIRHPLKSKAESSFSTIFRVKPHESHFDTLDINQTVVRERLIIAASNFKNLNIVFKIDEKAEVIKGSETNLIETYLGKNVDTWYDFECKGVKEKSNESCMVKIGWDFGNSSTKMETFTTVNFVKVESGAHIKKVSDILESVFQKIAKKNKFEFNSSDVLNWLRLYINLKVVNVEFESQTKEKLSKKTDLSIIESLESKIETYFKKLENVNELLEKFEYYRNSMQNKKINNNVTSSNKRSIAGFHKLRDCTMSGGELLIGEGDSAVGGLLQTRDPKKHAILPLRGVIINAAEKKLSEVVQNDVVKDIITAIGCGISPHCNIDKLRYSKIILSADPDPAGEFITALLITLFAKLTPEIIKNGNLFICKTPLFGYGVDSKFKPIWTQKELETARANNIRTRRFKGLGEFNPVELKTITLDENTRKLELVKWDDVVHKKLFEVMSNIKLRKDLVSNNYIY